MFANRINRIIVILIIPVNKTEQSHMKVTLKVLNKLKQERIIADYAIGGAIAAFFYIEPSLTNDMYVFIVIEDDSSFITLSPIYDRLKELGYSEFEKEGVIIDKWPVQFLPATGGLEKEALEKARDSVIEGEAVRVFTEEYLMALCVSVGRAKDKIRLAQFVSTDYDKCLFKDLLNRYDLNKKWDKIKGLISDE